MGLPDVKSLWKTFSGLPFGKRIFSWLFSLYAPYFLTIRPLVEDMKPGYGKVHPRYRILLMSI
jgi:hypothetical protein